MANHPSAEKRQRQNEKRQLRNRAVRSRLRTFVRRVREAVAAGNADEAAAHLRTASRALHKAVSNGVLHRNAAARRISRLTRAIQQLGRA